MLHDRLQGGVFRVGWKAFIIKDHCLLLSLLSLDSVFQLLLLPYSTACVTLFQALLSCILVVV
jgi:hypothetical protein